MRERPTDILKKMSRSDSSDEEKTLGSSFLFFRASIRMRKKKTLFQNRLKNTENLLLKNLVKLKRKSKTKNKKSLLRKMS